MQCVHLTSCINTSR